MRVPHFEVFLNNSVLKYHYCVLEKKKLLLGFSNSLTLHYIMRAGHSRYGEWLRAGRSGDRMLVGARFYAPVQVGTGAHPASCKMGTVSFPGVKSGRGVTLIPHPLLVPRSRKSRAIPLLPLWTVRHVQSLSACTVELYFYSPYGPYGL